MRWRTLSRMALLSVGVFVSFTLFCPLSAQQPSEDPDAEPKDASLLSQDLFLPTDVEARKKFEAVPEYLRTQNWDRVVRSLQPMLDAPEDALTPLPVTGPDGKSDVRYVSLWAEAGRLLGKLPEKGLEAYEVAQGRVARALLVEAEQNHSLELLAETARRYLHTQAGVRAADLLATYHLDRGQAVPAAQAFDRLLHSARADTLPPATLVKAALAFRLVGDEDGFKRAWKHLEERAPDGLRLRGRRITLEMLRKDVEHYRTSDGSTTDALAGSLSLQPSWRQPMLRDETTAALLTEAVSRTEGRGMPVIPAAVPVVVGDRVFTRTAAGVLAVERDTGRTAWEWRSDRSLESLAESEEERTGYYLDQWIGGYYALAPQVLFENSVLGSLTADARRLYAVDDLPLPPFPTNYAGYVGKAGLGLDFNFAERLTDAVYHSRLVALDQRSGKVLWELGGRGAKVGPLGDAHFLGPPLPCDDRLYQLLERNQELRLVCLDAPTGKLLWSQILAYTRARLILGGGRRLHAVTPLLADGVLICPTGSGAMFAVDRLSHRILWAHVYREYQPPPTLPDYARGRWRPRVVATAPPNLATEWKATPPLVHDRHLLFTSPEDDHLHCIRLRDGGSVWKIRRTLGDQYVAGRAGGHLVVVGDERVRGVALDEGKPVWSVSVGGTQGRGVLAGARLYLPVHTREGDRGYGIRVLDVEKGEIADTLLLGKQQPGNLLFDNGQVLSQTVSELTAYPIR